MDISWIKGLTVGAVIATTGGAIAGYNMIEQPTFSPPEFAEVVNVVPATEQVEVAREVCKDVEVTHKKDPRDKHRLMGTATGAVVGGVLGNQVGSGRGKALATVVGAAAGGLAGNKIQERAQSDDTYTTTETQCDTVVEYQDKVVGYDVTYRIGAEEGQVRMDRDPGEQIPLVNGELPSETPAEV
jgi:uncharacterized protein YcfJ